MDPTSNSSLIFAFVLHVLQRRGNGFGRLVGKPKTEEFFAYVSVHGVGHAKTDDDLTFSVRVPCVDDGIHVGTVTKPFDDLKLFLRAGIDA